MRTRSILLPTLGLGLAAILTTPGSRAVGFTRTGDSLGVGQRDYRLFNNFVDPTANDNMATKIMFPGAIQAEMAIWKGTVEWGSTIHGTGQGDPTQSVGDGGANFDPAWMGSSLGIGTSNSNVISTTTGCGGGILAFTELPTSNGWRIRFCEQNTWDDGPGFIGSRWDIQEVQCHEYGHALGLGHSGTNAATMFASGSPGSTSARSIHLDDKNGVQAIYGAAEPNKPVICETIVSAGTLTIHGQLFDPTSNDVWFTPAAATAANTADPRIRVLGVASTNGGTEITVAIPAAAGPGDVLVKTSAVGGRSLSNAFPVDLDLTLAGGTITSPALCAFSAVSMTPSTIESLDPGTAESVTVSGSQLQDVVSMDWNGALIASSRWTLVDNQTITIDMPQGGVLGAGNTLNLHTASETDAIPFAVVVPASPLLEIGTGDPFNTVSSGSSMNMVVAGTVGTTHKIYYSTSALPSVHPVASFDMGNGFTNFFFGAQFVVGAAGYTQFSAPVTFGGGSPTNFYVQSIDVTTPPAPTFGVSNLQTVTLTP